MKFFKKLSLNTRYWILFLIFIASLFFFSRKAWCEETATELATEAAFDALGAAISIGVAAEQAAVGNLFGGAAAVVVAGHEAMKAYDEAKQAWDMSRDRDSTNDCSVSPESANEDHGRD